MTAVRKGQPLLVAATAQVTTTSGVLQSIICTATGTIALYDNVTSTTTNEVLASFAVTAGNVYPMDMTFNFGIYAVIGSSATATFTVT
jgi:hypothetical protein